MATADSVKDCAVLSVADAAARLGLTPKALYARVQRRIIPFRKCGSKILFLSSELDRWLADLEGCTLEEARRNLAMRRGEEIAIR